MVPMVLVEMWVALVSMTRDSPKSASCTMTQHTSVHMQSCSLSSNTLSTQCRSAQETSESLLGRSSRGAELSQLNYTIRAIVGNCRGKGTAELSASMSRATIWQGEG